MYVCICKGITEGQVRDAIRGGACTRKDVSRCLKVGTACGKCNQSVRALLHQCGPSSDDSHPLAHAVERDFRSVIRPAPGHLHASEPVARRSRETVRADVEGIAPPLEPAACPA